MKRVFPRMHNHPGLGLIIPILAFGFMSIMYIPSVLPLLTMDISKNTDLQFWMECGYHLLNFLVIGALLIPSFKNELQSIKIGKKTFGTIGKTVLVTVGLMLAVVLVCAVLLMIIPDKSVRLFGVFPITEFNVFFSASSIIETNPIIGIVCNAVFAPMVIVGIFYAACFAPLGAKNTWLGYIGVTVFLALIAVYYIFYWSGYSGISTGVVIVGLLMHLPVHLLACWSCQKTDGIIAPILSLTAINLITSLAIVFIG